MEMKRRESQKLRILKALTQAGKAGVTNGDLNKIGFRYSAAIHELRKEGYRIETIDLGEGKFNFVMETIH